MENELSKEIFGEFYRFFGEEMIVKWSKHQDKKWKIDQTILIKNYYKYSKMLPIRTLILEMDEQNRSNHLIGKTKEEKYEFYNQIILSNKKYRKILADKYPELFRLMNLRGIQTIEALSEIVNNLKRDREVIIEKICFGQQFFGIKDIEIGFSDSHNGGKTVAKIILDNGYSIIYKPHGLKKEVLYYEKFEKISAQLGLKNKTIGILDCLDYGWESFLEQEECKSVDEVKRYFIRLGIHLFLAHILQGTDLHGENIIASGEYPIIVDFETFPGLMKSAERLTIEGMIKWVLDNGVHKTGILPIPFILNGEVAYLNALNSGKSQKIFIKMPVIENKKTVDMKIGYKECEIVLKNSLPILCGNIINASEYINEICTGFEMTYLLYIENSEKLKRDFAPFFEFDYRLVRRNTQQYAMLLSTSLHPSLLKSQETRKTFLKRIRSWNSQLNLVNEKIQDYEIESLLNLDIPIFYGHSNSTSIFDGKGKEYPDYTVENLFSDRIGLISKENLLIQKHIITKTLQNISTDISIKKNILTVLHCRDKNEYILKTVENIAQYLERQAIVNNQEDITWLRADYFLGAFQKFQPLNIYMYEGIAGVAIFFSKMLKLNTEKKYDLLYNCIKQKLYRYTDSIIQEIQPNIKSFGALEGESSLILSYLEQYSITEDVELLLYAKKHSEVIRKNYLSDRSYDFLSGNAGAIYGLVMLYRFTKEETYLELAEKIGEWLWKQVNRTQYGYGWIIQNEILPLAGMAHGNSGFILAYAELLDCTHKLFYVEIIKKLQAYEEQLYSEEIENWLDIRGNRDMTKFKNRNTIGWCHGAPGILLSRLRLKELKEFCDDPVIEKDIKRSVKALMKQDYSGKMCLCHGDMGNLLILKKFLDRKGDKKEEKKMNMWLENILERLQDIESYEKFEWGSPGLMMGLSGIGIALLKLID